MAGSGGGTRGAPSRTLVICCDGTWNKPEDQTNVWRTFDFLRDYCGEPYQAPDAVDGSVSFQSTVEIELPDGSEAEVPIFAFYDKGVGDERGGGVFGVGLGANVRQAYAFVARHWRPRASIFVFGFSRGAYTARSLCGMLNAVGIVDADDRAALDLVWEHYRRPPAERAPERPRIDALQHHGGKRGTVVRFLGIWDTVGSLGVPVPHLRWLGERWYGQFYRFHDTALGANVVNACQALAIHERRGNYKPVLWTRRHECVQDEEGNPTPQRMLQVWFTGSHSDVGGGYRGDNRLADVSLHWMLHRALESGHPLKEKGWVDRCDPNPLAARHDSSTSVWRAVAGEPSVVTEAVLPRIPVIGKPLVWALRFLAVRNVDRAIGGEIVTDDGQFVVGLGERLHASVIERFRGEHLPASVRVAQAAGLPVFHERCARREPCATDSRVMIDDDEAILIDRSKAGIGVGDAGWLQPNTRCRVALDGERWGARVAWTAGDRAGLALMYKLRGSGEPSPRLA